MFINDRLKSGESKKNMEKFISRYNKDSNMKNKKEKKVGSTAASIRERMHGKEEKKVGSTAASVREMMHGKKEKKVGSTAASVHEMMSKDKKEEEKLDMSPRAVIKRSRQKMKDKRTPEGKRKSLKEKKNQMDYNYDKELYKETKAKKEKEWKEKLERMLFVKETREVIEKDIKTIEENLKNIVEMNPEDQQELLHKTIVDALFLAAMRAPGGSEIAARAWELYEEVNRLAKVEFTVRVQNDTLAFMQSAIQRERDFIELRVVQEGRNLSEDENTSLSYLKMRLAALKDMKEESDEALKSIKQDAIKAIASATN